MVTREEEGERQLGIMRGHQATCMKDTWTKPEGVGSRVGGGDGWDERPR